MGRTTDAKSKSRMVCTTDAEETLITDIIGNGSRTAGVRKMLELVKALAKKNGVDVKTAIKNELTALSKYHDD